MLPFLSFSLFVENPTIMVPNIRKLLMSCPLGGDREHPDTAHIWIRLAEINFIRLKILGSQWRKKIDLARKKSDLYEFDDNILFGLNLKHFTNKTKKRRGFDMSCGCSANILEFMVYQGKMRDFISKDINGFLYNL